MSFDMSRCGDLLARLVHTGCERAAAGQEGGSCEYDFYDVTKLGQPYHRLDFKRKTQGDIHSFFSA